MFFPNFFSALLKNKLIFTLFSNRNLSSKANKQSLPLPPLECNGILLPFSIFSEFGANAHYMRVDGILRQHNQALHRWTRLKVTKHLLEKASEKLKIPIKDLAFSRGSDNAPEVYIHYVLLVSFLHYLNPRFSFDVSTWLLQNMSNPLVVAQLTNQLKLIQKKRLPKFKKARCFFVIQCWQTKTYRYGFAKNWNETLAKIRSWMEFPIVITVIFTEQNLLLRNCFSQRWYESKLHKHQSFFHPENDAEIFDSLDQIINAIKLPHEYLSQAEIAELNQSIGVNPAEVDNPLAEIAESIIVDTDDVDTDDDNGLPKV